MRIETKITGILLAAGKGSRFGGNKCAARLTNNRTMAAEIALNMRPAVDQLIVVLAEGDEILVSELGDIGVGVCVCRNASLGMSHSIRCGVETADPTHNILLALGDMPLIRSDTFLAIAEATRSNQLVRPAYRGIAGHPVGFSSNFSDALCGLRGDEGARQILIENGDRLLSLAVDDPGVVKDFDTKQSFNAHFFGE